MATAKKKTFTALDYGTDTPTVDDGSLPPLDNPYPDPWSQDPGPITGPTPDQGPSQYPDINAGGDGGGGGFSMPGGGSGGGFNLGDLLKMGAGAGSQLMSHEDMVAMLAQQLRLANTNTALEESKLDPWRQQMTQVRDMGALDRAANMNYEPQQVGPAAGGPWGSFQPTLKARAMYKPSAAMIAAAIRQRDKIASGQGGMPTMTDPNNWGKPNTTNFGDLFDGQPTTAPPTSADDPQGPLYRDNPRFPRGPGGRGVPQV